MELVQLVVGGTHVRVLNSLKTTCYEQILGVQDVIESYM